MPSAAAKTPFVLILLLWGAGLGAAAQYAKISVIFDQLPKIYPQSEAALGFIVSIVGFVGIAFGVAAGILVARFGYRRALLWALWSGAVLSALQAFLPPLWVMLSLRALEGASHLAIVVAAPTFIAQLSQERHRPLTLSLWSTFFSVAFTLLVWLGLPLVHAFGVASLFIVHALWMALFAVILSRKLDKLPRTNPAPRLDLRGMLLDHKTIYTSPYIAATGVGWLFYTFCFLALLTLLPPFMDPATRNAALGAMPLISIVVSMTIGVYALRYLSAITVVIVGFALVILALVWLAAVPGGTFACFALAAALGLVQGASFAAVPQLCTTPADQVRANGAMAQMGNIGNTLGTPVLAAVLLGAGYFGMIWSAILITAAGLLAHLWMMRRRQLTRDVRNT